MTTATVAADKIDKNKPKPKKVKQQSSKSNPTVVNPKYIPTSDVVRVMPGSPMVHKIKTIDEEDDVENV